jgi:anti-anti-sigma factor
MTYNALPMADDSVHVISLEGQFDIYCRDQFAAALDPAVEHPRVILDCSKLRYIDSTCLTVLVNVRKQRQMLGYPAARIVGLVPPLLRMFKITGLDRLWPVDESIEEAKASLEIGD